MTLSYHRVDPAWRWERGYRVHGLWDRSGRQVGRVGLSPRGPWPTIYTWLLWREPVDDPSEGEIVLSGESSSLREAKRAVEAAQLSPRHRRAT